MAEVGEARQQASDDAPVEAWQVLDRRAARGEQCLVCRKMISSGEIVEVRYKGRRFHVAESMLDAFIADPDRHFAALEAHSALFDERAVEIAAPSAESGWLTFGLYGLVGLLCGAWCAYLALGRGRSPGVWFTAGLLANVVSVAVLLSMRRADNELSVPRGLAKLPLTRAPIACDGCGAPNHPAAGACSSCGKLLNPAVKAETALS